MTKILIMCGIVLALLVVVQFPVYYVWQYSTTAELLWNAEECYLFINMRRAGWYGSILQDIGATIKAYGGGFGGVTPPRTMVNDILVWHFSTNGTQHFTVPNTSRGPLMVFEGRIYARLGEKSVVLSRWTNGTFQAVQGAEEERFTTAERITGEVRGGNFSNVDGWSKMTNVLSRSLEDYTLVVPLPHQELWFHVSHRDQVETIALQKPPHPPERLWSLSTRPRRVSRRAYEVFFRSGSPKKRTPLEK